MKTNSKTHAPSRIAESGPREDRRAGNGKSSNGNGKAKTNGDNSEKMPGESMLDKFFEEELRDLYWAEKHLVKELGKMAAKATSPELVNAFTDHQVQTAEHVTRIERVFEMIGKKATAKKCEAIAGITKEVGEIIGATESDTFTRDVALIVGAQKVEHYEIATYGSLVQIARTLGKINVAAVLDQTLKEEKNADSLLTHIAESYINEEATNESEQE